AGMGCVKQGGGGGNDDVFRIGEAQVTRLPVANNDIVTQGNVALCFGDSGGSVFWKDPQGIYKVAGVNSRGDIRTTSYLSAVFTKDAKSFYSSWASQNKTTICGLSVDAKNCRGQNNEPDPSPVPPWCAETLKKVNLCIYGQPRQALTDIEGCRDAYGQLFACQMAAELP
ncbi:MAG: hypothetical protein EBX40_08315, partial [Gammaproteobacteria bacterium]|nr:hypothetical protein [Gammaproteobacteria bacterium]